MPTYDFLCEACDAKFEALLRSRTAKATCPMCASKKVKKQISSFRMNLGAEPEAMPFTTCSCGSDDCAP